MLEKKKLRKIEKFAILNSAKPGGRKREYFPCDQSSQERHETRQGIYLFLQSSGVTIGINNRQNFSNKKRTVLYYGSGEL